MHELVKSNNIGIVQIKENQSMIFSEAVSISQECECMSSYHQRAEKGHGRIDSRRARVFIVPKLLKNTCSEWEEVKCIVEVKRTRKEFDTKEKRYRQVSVKYSYYASTEVFSAKKFLGFIRNHWKIENKNHYVKDVTMKEDKSRIRKSSTVIAILRSFALNILRLNNYENISAAMFSVCLDFNKLLNLKGIA